MTRRSLLEIPSGVQCFLGEEARLRREVERSVSDVFRGWSYDEIVLPLFDFDDVFTRGGSSTSTGGIYRFIGREGDVLALRSDFTALVAKVVVSRLSRQTPPLRLFYSGEVLRYQPPRAGQREELYQVGLEHLGAGDVASDVEVILVAREALSRLGIEDAVITLGHVGFALSILGRLEDDGEGRGAALDAMRRHDRRALQEVLGGERASSWSAWMGLAGDAEVLREAGGMVATDEGREALRRLVAVADLLDELGLSHRVRFDLGEVRGFEYYTGLVFEIHAESSGIELGGGGRYDSLLGRFGREMPAVGFSLSLDRLAEHLEGRGGRDTLLSKDEPLSIPLGERCGRALAAALEERRGGRRVRVER
jgi:ATP phosphoribosyltransferase regulatory subunit